VRNIVEERIVLEQETCNTKTNANKDNLKE